MLDHMAWCYSWGHECLCWLADYNGDSAVTTTGDVLANRKQFISDFRYIFSNEPDTIWTNMTVFTFSWQLTTQHDWYTPPSLTLCWSCHNTIFQELHITPTCNNRWSNDTIQRKIFIQTINEKQTNKMGHQSICTEWRATNGYIYRLQIYTSKNLESTIDAGLCKSISWTNDWIWWTSII